MFELGKSGSGAGMMMKALGLDPEKLMSSINGFASAFNAMNDKLEAIAKTQHEINRKLDYLESKHEHLEFLMNEQKALHNKMEADALNDPATQEASPGQENQPLAIPLA